MLGTETDIFRAPQDPLLPAGAHLLEKGQGEGRLQLLRARQGGSSIRNKGSKSGRFVLMLG